MVVEPGASGMMGRINSVLLLACLGSIWEFGDQEDFEWDEEKLMRFGNGGYG